MDILDDMGVSKLSAKVFLITTPLIGINCLCELKNIAYYLFFDYVPYTFIKGKGVSWELHE